MDEHAQLQKYFYNSIHTIIRVFNQNIFLHWYHNNSFFQLNGKCITNMNLIT